MPRRELGQKRGGRRGYNFVVRLTPDERAALESAHSAAKTSERGAPRGLGAFMVERALSGAAFAGPAMPELGHCRAGAAMPPRVILDLCGGSGAWSEPYRRAGYDVRLVTLPEHDVREYAPPDGVHGVLAAPPCDQFSVGRNGWEGRDGVPPRDFAEALTVVTACLRVLALARPAWWALENPQGLLSRWLGTPRFNFRACEFGDPWEKPTNLWGSFALPTRGPYVEPRPECSPLRRPNAAARAITAPGFAAAFFAANP